MPESKERDKCVTFTWTIENISYFWHKADECVRSPTFVINAQQEWKYFLALIPITLEGDHDISFRIHVEGNQSFLDIDGELALLSKDGSLLTSQKFENDKNSFGSKSFEERKIFILNRSNYMPEDTLTARCRIWKRAGKMVEDIQCFARTRISIEKEVFLWDIQNFSRFQSEEIFTYLIKSVLDNEVWMTLNLYVKNLFSDSCSINIQLTSENRNIKYCVFHLVPLNCFGSISQGIREEFLFSDNKSKLLTVHFSKYDLMGNKYICLPNDVLSFRCECTFSTGKILEKIERVVYDCASEAGNNFLKEENLLSVSKLTLNENLKSLFQDNILPDVNLKTSTKSFPAHKNILSIRSSVFKAMFSNDMEGKVNESIDIEDLDSDIVFRMLFYIYTAEIQDLQWEKAYELYRAAAKYKIFTLKDECSAYLKSNLSLNNACDVLILADLHQDEDLKASAENFIFDHDVINSEAFKQLMKTHVKLAADTMYLQIQRKTLDGFKTEVTSPTGINFKFKAPIGPTIKFNPPTGTDTMNKGGIVTIVGTRHQCITCMEEYENKSLEELRFENYVADSEECSTTGGKAFRAPTLQSSIFSTSTTSASDFSFGEKQSDNFFHTTSAKEFSVEFGSNSMRPPSSYPWFEGTLAETATATFGLSSNNIRSQNKGFNFKTTEKASNSSFSFSSCDQKTSVENSSEKRSLESAFSFDSSKENAPANAHSLLRNTNTLFSGNNNEPNSKSFSLVSNNEKVPIKPSFSIGNHNFKPSFSFGSTVEKKPVRPFFSFSSNKMNRAVKPTFSITSTSDKRSFNTFSSLGRIEEKEISSVPFSFIKSGERGLVNSFSSTGNIIENEPSNMPFSFGFYVRPSFSLGSKLEFGKPPLSSIKSDDKKYIKSCFSFGNSSEKEFTELISTSSSSEVEPVEQSFLLSSNKEEDHFDATVSSAHCDSEDENEKEPSEESLSTSISNEVEPVEQSVLLSRYKEEDHSDAPVSSARCDSEESSEKEPSEESF